MSPSSLIEAPLVLTGALFALLASTPAASASVPAPEAPTIEVVTTLGVLGSLAKEVGGEFVHVETLADARQDPHFVEPKPTLMQKARAADVFIEIGLQLELWADKVVVGSGNPRIQAGQPGRIIASAGVATLELPQAISREWGDVHPYGNPHIWLDPVNAKQMAANIAAGLSAVDPEHAANYARGLAGFERRLDEALFGKDLVEQVGGKKLARLAEQGRLAAYLEQKELTDLLGGWLAEARPLAGRPLVTYHKTCVYFAARFGLAIQLEIEEKPGIPPSARWRDHVLEVMRREGVHTIAQEVFYDRTAAEYLARETGARVVVFPLDVGPEVDVADYFALIQGILDRLLESERGK